MVKSTIADKNDEDSHTEVRRYSASLSQRNLKNAPINLCNTSQADQDTYTKGKQSVVISPN